ncbi:sulfotransferase family protein [Rhizomonospora bruguierae]|uniref:sulfotransferase family protein n=1 Tax=Rhizomonospora bruguierae TaxID=1581705 RepID=UPI001BCFA520|nr:sulfotransferase [Micromonospora sp. NBRC 107566]
MAWQHVAHYWLTAATGLQLTRGARWRRLSRPPATRLRAPVFIFTSVRSGSTLLRMILNSHSRLYAPHELHLTGLQVQLKDKYVTDSMTQLGLTEPELDVLLWDSVMATALARSGKSVLVEKTPHHVFMWSRIARTWPEARFVFLLRHPAAVLDSWRRARSWQTADQAAAHITRYATALDEARRNLPGHTLRYEDLIAQPEPETQRLCEFIGVPWEPGMLEYGRRDHGPIRSGLGDWTERIRSGRIQQPRPLPDTADLPAELAEIAQRWGYQVLQPSTRPV